VRKALSRKEKLKIYAVDAAMLFMAVRMTTCINADKEQQRERANVSYEVVTIADEKNTEQIGYVEPEQVTVCEAETKQTVSVAERYMLAKLAMAEAENQDIEGKALVICVVLNRLADSSFPDSISEVIYHEGQFSPVSDGRYDRVEPDEDCYKAADMVLNDGWDNSEGALYFERKSSSKWHSQHLKFLFKHGDHYFYTEEN